MIKLNNRYRKVLRQKTTATEEQTRIPLKLIIEKIWCRQKEKKLSTSFKFQSMQIWSRPNETYSNETLQKYSSRGQITFGSQLQTFP